MHLVPLHERGGTLKHLRLTGATTSSNSLAAPGTGLVYVPVYAWCTASGISSIQYLNGTAGSGLFQLKAGTSNTVEVNFWEEPSQLEANHCPVIETVAGIGVHDIHVWLKAVRCSAGQDAIGQ